MPRHGKPTSNGYAPRTPGRREKRGRVPCHTSWDRDTPHHWWCGDDLLSRGQFDSACEGCVKCRACHQPHPATMRCEVWKRIASNNASNAGSHVDRGRPTLLRRVGVAKRPVRGRSANHSLDDQQTSAGREAVSSEQGVALPVDKKQRWDRKAYNTYQREYMKKRRAALRAIR